MKTQDCSYALNLSWLYELNVFAKGTYDLDNMHELRKAFSFPDKAFNIVHVGGTNGKGSVSTKIAKALELEGYKVGVFSSPHLFSFRERVQVNSEFISQDSICLILEEIRSYLEENQLKASFFEVLFLLACLYFREQKVDVAILEVGLGGRLDATNIITPILSVITSVSYDHQNVLGNTLEEIAQENLSKLRGRKERGTLQGNGDTR